MSLDRWYIHLQILNTGDFTKYGDFPRSPIVKTSPSTAGDVGSIPGQGLRSHMPLGQTTKTQNRNNIVTNSTNIFLNGSHKKFFKWDYVTS